MHIADHIEQAWSHTRRGLEGHSGSLLCEDCRHFGVGKRSGSHGCSPCQKHIDGPGLVHQVPVEVTSIEHDSKVITARDPGSLSVASSW